MLKKISLSQLTLYVLMAVTIVIACLFYFGGYVDPNAEYAEPVYTNALIILMYVLVAIGAVAAVVASVINFAIRIKTDAKQTMRGIIISAVLVLILVITYTVSSGETVAVLGDSIPLSETWLKLVDMQLYTMYILLGIAIVITLLGSFAKKIK